MAVAFKETNVFDEALNRIRMIYDYHDDVIVCMSGGKDSTVVFNLALMVAKERNRLPVKVFWLDQEAEWQNTVDYMNNLMRRPDVKPFWYQVPFEFPNNLSTMNESLLIWDPAKKDMWIHPQSDIAITESPIDMTDINRDKAFYVMMDRLPEYCVDENAKNCAVLYGMRVDESLVRRTAILNGKAQWRGETWCRGLLRKTDKCRVFWPIYDFLDDDVWTAIAKNHWEYNKTYDLMYRWGTNKRKMRVSALIHETAWHAIEMLQEFEPQTYNRFIARIHGTSNCNHAFDEGGFMPSTLPFMFKDWKEYRDYLLVHLVDPKYWDHYKKEWNGQDGENWYRDHVCEVILNDTCGTINRNAKTANQTQEKISNGKFFEKNLLEFMRFKEENNGN